MFGMANRAEVSVDSEALVSLIAIIIISIIV